MTSLKNDIILKNDAMNLEKVILKNDTMNLENDRPSAVSSNVLGVMTRHIDYKHLN